MLKTYKCELKQPCGDEITFFTAEVNDLGQAILWVQTNHGYDLAYLMRNLKVTEIEESPENTNEHISSMLTIKNQIDKLTTTIRRLNACILDIHHEILTLELECAEHFGEEEWDDD